VARRINRAELRGAVILASQLAALASRLFVPPQEKHRQNKALAAACVVGDLQAVRDALAKGADPKAPDETGLTPLMHAARGDRPNMSNPAADYPEVVQLLLEKGVDPNAATDSGFVALFWAARYGHEQLVKVLIDHGANVNARDKDGLTALKWAETNQSASPETYKRVIELLRKAVAGE
jgi:ankyrin repeat protein